MFLFLLAIIGCTAASVGIVSIIGRVAGVGIAAGAGCAVVGIIILVG